MPKRPEPSVAFAEGFSICERLAARHWIAYKQDMKVWIARADGSDRREVFDENKHSLNCPLAWSPDGKTLYHSHGQVYAIDVVTGAARAVTHFPEQAQNRVIWHLSCSPDGKRLSCLQSVNNPPGGNRQISHRFCIVPTDGAAIQVMQGDMEERYLWGAAVCWPHDLAAFSVIGKNTHELWTATLDGKELRYVGSGPAGQPGPVLSPDGRQAVFSDNGLSLMSMDSGEIRQLSRAGTCPSWSPDGSEIAFMNGDYELWTVSVTDGSFRKLAWVGGRNYPTMKGRGSYAHEPVWSPDGRLLWFRLTKTRRLRKLTPERVKWIEEAPLEHVPEQRREAERQRMRERSLWDYQHRIGIVDLRERRVWLADGYWSNVAWSPTLDQP